MSKMNKCKQCDFKCHDYAFMAEHVARMHTTNTQPQTQQSGGDELDLWMESLGFSRLIDDTTPLNYTYYKQAGFGLIDTFTAGFFYKVCQAREREAELRGLKDFEPFVRDHTNCPDRMSCIGYQNAVSDFDNEREIAIERLSQPKPQAGEGGEG